jgi:hypothetical protein
MMMVCVFFPALVLGQHIFEEAQLTDIQEAYYRGDIDVESAVLMQFKLLYDDSAVQTEERHFQKCATPAYIFYYEYKDQLSSQTVQKIEAYQSLDNNTERSLSEETHISPSGKFRITYQASGNDAVPLEDENEDGVPDYVERVAESADSSYRHEVINLGFPDPIPEGDMYDIFLVDGPCGPGVYGCALKSTDKSVKTEILIENDFEDFPSNTHPEGDQIGAIYATVAHELKHAIQFVQNEWRGEVLNWHEMDATLMEEIVYDDVNDYYNYIETSSANLFASPSTSLIPGSYWEVTWAIYFYEKFGDYFWTDVWERIEANPSITFLDAVDARLSAEGTTFKEEVTEVSLWHYASGINSNTGTFGFKEKELYPTPKLDSFFEFVSEDTIDLQSVNRMATKYIEVYPGPADRGYIDMAVNFDTTQIGIGVLFYLKNGETDYVIATGESKSQLYVPTKYAWTEVEKVGISVFNFSKYNTVREVELVLGKEGNPVNIKDPDYPNIPNQITVYQNYPNPFNPETTIRIDLERPSQLVVEVFDITGRKVRTLANGFHFLGVHTIPFDASSLSSGIYIYRVQSGNDVITKKMTLIK